jgi:site-specific DNA recombinase
MQLQHNNPDTYSASVRAVASSQRLATYERVSGEKQEKEDTIENQTMALDAAVAACGGRIVERYRDNPYTGTVAHRPALDRLMKDAGKTFTHLLIYDTHRLARGKPYLRPMLEEELRDKGATLAYLNYEMEDSAIGRAKDGMYTVFNEWEREQIVGRLETGKNRKRSKGHVWRGSRPYGWLYIKAPMGEKHGHMEHHPDEVAIVREIFERIAAGETSATVANDLNRRGLRTTRGEPWKPLSVRVVVHNPIHTGRTPLRRFEACKPSPERRRSAYPKRPLSSARPVPRDEWAFPDPETRRENGIDITPIVPVDLQEAALAALQTNKKRSTRNAKHPYPLRGLVYCMVPRKDDPTTPCGRRMTGNGYDKTHKRRYTCSRPYPNLPQPTRCGRWVDAEKLESAVWSFIESILQDPDMVRRQWEITQQAGAEERERAERLVARAQEAYNVADAALTNIMRTHARGKMSDDDFDRMYAEFGADRDTAREALQEAQARRQSLDPLAGQWESVTAWLQELRGLLALARQPGNETYQERLIQAIVERITYDGTDWWLSWRWGGDASRIEVTASATPT